MGGVGTMGEFLFHKKRQQICYNLYNLPNGVRFGVFSI